MNNTKAFQTFTERPVIRGKMSKLSQNIGTFKCGKYVVTCASWGSDYPKSYELGLRDTSLPRDDDNHFLLVQSEYFREFNILHYGALAAAMMNHGLTPSNVSRIFSNAETMDDEFSRAVVKELP